jgi:APA family basic amino acid/polyamine antiporter
MLVMLMGQSRVFYTMSNDGLLPAFFSEIHENSHTMENKPFFMGLLVYLLV